MTPLVPVFFYCITDHQTFLPTILLTVFMPILTGLLTTVAEKLTVSENYETQDGKILPKEPLGVVFFTASLTVHS